MNFAMWTEKNQQASNLQQQEKKSSTKHDWKITWCDSCLMEHLPPDRTIQSASGGRLTTVYYKHVCVCVPSFTLCQDQPKMIRLQLIVAHKSTQNAFQPHKLVVAIQNFGSLVGFVSKQDIAAWLLHRAAWCA